MRFSSRSARYIFEEIERENERTELRKRMVDRVHKANLPRLRKALEKLRG